MAADFCVESLSSVHLVIAFRIPDLGFPNIEIINDVTEHLPSRNRSLSELQRLVATHFDMDELQMVAFALGVDWDELKGTTKSLKTVALIHHLDRRGGLNDLLGLLGEERPSIAWPTIQPSTLPVPTDNEQSGGHLAGLHIQSQSGGTVNVGNVITGHVDGDIVKAVAPDSSPAQRGQMSPGTKLVAQVPSQCADVCPR